MTVSCLCALVYVSDCSLLLWCMLASSLVAYVGDCGLVFAHMMFAVWFIGAVYWREWTVYWREWTVYWREWTVYWREWTVYWREWTMTIFEAQELWTKDGAASDLFNVYVRISRT